MALDTTGLDAAVKAYNDLKAASPARSFRDVSNAFGSNPSAFGAGLDPRRAFDSVRGKFADAYGKASDAYYALSNGLGAAGYNNPELLAQQRKVQGLYDDFYGAYGNDLPAGVSAPLVSAPGGQGGGFGKFLKKAAPIALAILGSAVLGPAIAPALGISSAAGTSALGGAIGGGLGGAVSGGGLKAAA
jgi:hypothetical protein